MAKKAIKPVTAEEINAAHDVLARLVLQGKYAHMKTPVQSILGGLLLPNLVDQGEIDASNPQVAELLKSYSKVEVKKQLNPEPVVVQDVIHERPVYRRLKSGLKKEKRFERELDTAARDVMIRWWNTNQRLVPKDDPVCATLTEQINALSPGNEPLSPMQISGYFSHLCRMGQRTEDDRTIRFSKSIERGAHTIMPKYSPELIKAIEENWEHERANEQARKADHAKIRQMRQNGEYKPVIAKV